MKKAFILIFLLIILNSLVSTTSFSKEVKTTGNHYFKSEVLTSALKPERKLKKKKRNDNSQKSDRKTRRLRKKAVDCGCK